MKRLLAVVVVGLVAASLARADLIPPGTKNIAINHKIETDTEHTDWVFFVVRGSGGVHKAALDPKHPLTVAGSAGVGNGPAPQPGEKRRSIAYRSNLLVAVPKDAGKKYETEKAFHEAIEDGKVPGMVRVKDAFYDHENAKATDPRKTIVRQFRVTKIDAKEGIVLEAVKPEGNAKPEEEGVSASFPWVATGLALTAAVCFTGLWLSRRTRRES